MRRGITPGILVKVATISLGVVAIIVFVGWFAGGIRRTDAVRRIAAHAQISGFMTALGTYRLETGTFPTTEQGLKALREKPEGVNVWQGPYLQKDIPKDPWENDYAYKFPGDHGTKPDIVSYGLDGQPGGDGNNADIVSWKND